MASANVTFIPVFLTVVEGHQVLWSVIFVSPAAGTLDVRTRAFSFPGDKSALRTLLLGSFENIISVQSGSCYKPPDWRVGTMPKCLPSSFGQPRWTYVHSFIHSFNKLLDAGYHSAADVLIKTQSLAVKCLTIL